MVERLENLTIASYRSNLLNAKAVSINEMWNKIGTISAISERGSYRQELRREIIAQLLANFFSLLGGCIFGSWPRTRNNTKPWRDLDISLPLLNFASGTERWKVELFLNSAKNYIHDIINSLNGSDISIRDVIKDQTEVDTTIVNDYQLSTIDFSVYLPEGIISIQCDIVNDINCLYLPVTIGSNLTWSKTSNFQIRNKTIYSIDKPSIENILEFLKDGKDIKIWHDVDSSKKDEYAKYYWKRITLIQMDNINLHFRPAYGFCHHEPIKPSET